jgi:predicted DsbA family dithiol-disulfide isomerase
MSTQPRLEIFSDYICPYCYFITGSIKRLEAELNVAATWRCFPLHPEIPYEGILLSELFNQPALNIEPFIQNIQQTAFQLGLPLSPLKKTFNTRLAQEVGLWAAEQGKGDLFHMAAFKAYFVDEQNLALKDVLMDLVESVGLPSTKADEIIEKRVFRDAVDQDWALSRRMNITAVPTLMLGGKQLVGAQPYEQMARFVSQNIEAAS